MFIIQSQFVSNWRILTRVQSWFLNRKRSLVGWNWIHWGVKNVRFNRRGMQMRLHGLRTPKHSILWVEFFFVEWFCARRTATGRHKSPAMTVVNCASIQKVYFSNIVYVKNLFDAEGDVVISRVPIESSNTEFALLWFWYSSLWQKTFDSHNLESKQVKWWRYNANNKQ